ncbi:MAG: hypothetical protein NVSMB19_08950 [Vulcanimicrobiaceae bacterium]
MEYMSGSTISRDSGSRLASFIEDRRRNLVASIVGSSVLPRPGSIAANAFTNSFLDRLAQELEDGDAKPLCAWAKAGAADENAFEHARIVVIACATLNAAYVAQYGHADDIVSYLALRSGELEKFFRPEPNPAVAPNVYSAKMVDRDEVVSSLLSAIEARDPATCEHSRAVGMWCGRMAKQMGMPAAEQAFAALAGTLHDVGKIATPTDVLLKPGALTDVEWESMRAHSRIGAKMLERIPSLREIAPVVRAHHERVDGSGYPDRLAGQSIPLVARIVAVADSFHAMISKRPYRQAMPVAAALDELRRGIGTQWDPLATDAMLAIVQPSGIARALNVVRATR